MFPIRDSIPRVHTPYAVYTIIAINVLVYLYQQALSSGDLFLMLHTFGVVPARYAFPEWAAHVGYPTYGQFAFITHQFIHGSWSHLLLNMWSLWIFADNIEDVMGPVRFTLFYLCCGLAAMLTHMLSDTAATVPIVGASGAIAGVMGAYFLLYPHAKVTTLIPIVIIPLFFELPALLYLGIWFAMQVLSGLGSLVQQGGGASIAWWAHAGGFVAGIILLPLFRRKGHCYYCRIPEGTPPHKAVITRPHHPLVPPAARRDETKED